MTSATNPMGGQWQYTWNGATYQMLTVRDPRGNLMVTNEYDVNGRVIKQTYADSTTSLFAYTLSGSVVTEANVTDRRGNVRKVELNAGGRVTRNTFALGLPEQHVTTFTWQPVTNLLSSTTDALGRRTDYTYDARGNMLTTTRLAGTANAVTTTYTYTTAFNEVASVKDPLNHTTTLTYDAFGNITRITDPLNHQINVTYDGAGQVLTVKNALNHVTTYTYDEGVIASVKDPLNRITTLYTDGVGRTVRVKDPLGNATQTAYDAMNRVTRSTDAIGNTVGYEYDANGNLTANIDQRMNRTTFVYDVMNRVQSRRDALGNVETFIYDAAGKLVRSTDRKGQVSGFNYDARNRRTQAGFGATIANPTAYTSTTQYTYDAGKRLTQANSSSGGTVGRAYDGLDRLTSETTALGTVSYTYDAAGRKTTRSVPGQATTTYSWDNANRLTALTQGSLSMSFAYDNANRRTGVTLPNGVIETYAYDSAGQLIGITCIKGSTTLGDLTYTYGLDGRRIGIGGSFARTEMPPVIAATALNAINQLTQWDAQALSYDLNGNLVADGTYTYVWNAQNQLEQLLQSGTQIASYQYDPFGRRAQKVINGTTTRFLYDDANFVQERDGANSITADVLTGMALDEVYSRTKTTGTSSFLTDHLGSVIAEADATGTVQTSYNYEPYGNTTQIGAASDNSQRYTAREQDVGHVYYYRARYLTTRNMRFAAEDPIGFAGGPNLYAYVSDAPTQQGDPRGLFGPGFPRYPDWPPASAFPPGSFGPIPAPQTPPESCPCNLDNIGNTIAYGLAGGAAMGPVAWGIFHGGGALILDIIGPAVMGAGAVGAIVVIGGVAYYIWAC